MRRASSIIGSPRAQRTFTTVTTPDELLQDLSDLVWVGAGSYGAVFKGKWRDAAVALKFILSDTMDEEGASYREAVLGSQLSNPHVVQTYVARSARLDERYFKESATISSPSYEDPNLSFSFASGHSVPADKAVVKGATVSLPKILSNMDARLGQHVVVIIMELCDAGSLHTIISKGFFKPRAKWGKTVILRAMLRSAGEVAKGMVHLHNLGIIHRDLKASNILLKATRDDRRGFTCKVSDFGLSREFCGSSRSCIAASTWATINYMAPEQYQGKLSKAVDSYAFGAVLWELYHGDIVFHEYNPGQIIQGVQSGCLRPTWVAGAPPGLVTLATRCFAFDPQDRPTFVEIVDRLMDLEEEIRVEQHNKARDGSPASPSPAVTLSAAPTSMPTTSSNPQPSQPLWASSDAAASPADAATAAGSSSAAGRDAAAGSSGGAAGGAAASAALRAGGPFAAAQRDVPGASTAPSPSATSAAAVPAATATASMPTTADLLTAVVPSAGSIRPSPFASAGGAAM